jgi:hypothetical protein
MAGFRNQAQDLVRVENRPASSSLVGGVAEHDAWSPAPSCIGRLLRIDALRDVNDCGCSRISMSVFFQWKPSCS